MAIESFVSLKLRTRLAITALLLVAVTNLPGIPDTAFWNALENFAHAPLFGAAALFIVRMLLRRNDCAQPGTPHPYWQALGIAVALGAATEILQLPFGHDAEFGDLVTDAAGAASFLAVQWSFCACKRKVFRWTAALAALLVIGFTVAPAVSAGAAVLHRNRLFPVLADFDSGRASRFLAARSASLELVPAPAASSLSDRMRMARVTFKPALYPGFTIEEPYPDWTGYRDLRFLIYSELSGPAELVVRVNDARHNNELSDRFNSTLTIKPGLNSFRVPLEEIEKAPSGRRMDMRAIRGLTFFAISPPKPFVLYFGDIRLTK